MAKNIRIPAHRAIFNLINGQIPGRFSSKVNREELIFTYCLLLAKMVIPQDEKKWVTEQLQKLQEEFDLRHSVRPAINHAINCLDLY